MTAKSTAIALTIQALGNALLLQQTLFPLLEKDALGMVRMSLTSPSLCWTPFSRLTRLYSSAAQTLSGSHGPKHYNWNSHTNQKSRHFRHIFPWLQHHLGSSIPSVWAQLIKVIFYHEHSSISWTSYHGHLHVIYFMWSSSNVLSKTNNTSIILCWGEHHLPAILLHLWGRNQQLYWWFQRTSNEQYRGNFLLVQLPHWSRETQSDFKN